MPTTTYTAEGTPVITLTDAEWDELRARNAARDPEEAARERAERRARWVAERKAYEAAQAAKAEAEALAAKKAATPRTKAERRTNRRQLQATLRQRRHDNQATHRATKAVATGRPQSAKNHLIAAGLTPADAKRFAGAFSRGVIADGAAETRIKLRRRVTRLVNLKLYSAATFAARMATYRPKDKAAAARFERIALAA